LTFKDVYIVKTALGYLANNMYQADKMFVDCFELHSNFVALSEKREVKDKCKHKRAAQEKKKESKKNQKCMYHLCTLYFDICLASLN
jgi:hypothetical protein